MINLYGLKYFYDSCRYQSMTIAAELNHVSRPAISQAIRTLELELGVPLLHHKRRGFFPTAAGLLLVKQTVYTFAQLDHTCSLLKEVAGKIQGPFRIGSARTLVTFELKHVIQKFLVKYPDVEIKIRIYNSGELIEKLAERELDLIVFLGDEALEGHEQITIKKGQFCLIKPKKTSTAMRFALTEARPEIVRLKDLYKKKHGSDLPVYAEIHSWDAIWNWASEGICGGLIPDFLMPKQNKNIEVVMKNIWPYEIKAMYAKARAHDPLIVHFLKHF